MFLLFDYDDLYTLTEDKRHVQLRNTKLLHFIGTPPKSSMRINQKHFVYTISLPELAWKNCKQTGL